MSTIYIDRRNVTATNRNKRITEYTNNTTTSGNNGGGSGVYLFENGVKVTGSTVSLSGEYSGYTENLGQWKITGATKNEIIVTGTTGTTGTTIVYDVTGFTGNTVEIKGDVFIDGNLKVSKEVTAYFASELTGSTFDLLSVSQPLLKEGTNISLMYDSEKLVINDSGELTLTSGFTENLSLTWENINNKPSTFPPSAHTHTDLIPFTVSGNTIYGNSGLNLHIDGNISASNDVIAYLTNSVSSNIFDNLSVSQPLRKSGTNIELNYNEYFFELIGGELSIKDSVVATKEHSHSISEIMNLQNILNSKVNSSGLTENFIPKYSINGLIDSDIYESNSNIGIGTTGTTEDKLTVSGDTKIFGDLSVEGNITATGEVAAYITSAITTNVLDNLSTVEPLFKTGSTIGLNYSNQFYTSGGTLYVSGATGSSGTNGTSGTSGLSGSSGTSGTSGSSGVSGVNGSSGTSGSSGSSGSSGYSGTSGSSGSSGSSGTSGLLPAIGNNYELLFRNTGTTYGYNTSPNLKFDGSTLYVTGSIQASSEITAYVASAVSSDVLNNLSVSAPLQKTGTNIALNYNTGQFELNGSTLQIKSGIISAGSSGTSGSSGYSGTNGTSGTSGSSGISGINGTSGTSGFSGANGTSGSSGTSGYNGTSGSSGSSGSSGYSGANGTSGSSGSSGSSGTTPVMSNYVTNTNDSYTSIGKITSVITLTLTEYNAIGTKDSNTLYIII